MWILEGFPKLVDKLSDIAVMTAGRSGVVAALSKYIILFFLPFVVISGYFYKDLIYIISLRFLFQIFFVQGSSRVPLGFLYDSPISEYLCKNTVPCRHLRDE